MSTVAALLTLPDAERFELVDGQFVERPMSVDSVWVAGEVFGRLREYARPTDHGWAFPDGVGYQCFAEDDERVRRPDASYIVKSRLPDGPAPTGYCRICPDLAVEVISPSDVYYEIEDKIEEYLAAGVRQVWVVSPHSRSMVIHRADQRPLFLNSEAELSGDDLLPGFHCRVSELFPPRP